MKLLSTLLLVSGVVVHADRNCFQSNTELRRAVRDYVSDSSKGSEVAQNYGVPIGTWCFDEQLTDFFSCL